MILNPPKTFLVYIRVRGELQAYEVEDWQKGIKDVKELALGKNPSVLALVVNNGRT